METHQEEKRNRSHPRPTSLVDKTAANIYKHEWLSIRECLAMPISSSVQARKNGLRYRL